MNILDIVKKNEENIELEDKRKTQDQFNLLSYEKTFYFSKQVERRLI